VAASGLHIRKGYPSLFLSPKVLSVANNKICFSCQRRLNDVAPQFTAIVPICVKYFLPQEKKQFYELSAVIYGNENFTRYLSAFEKMSPVYKSANQIC
jgi:hypothetical protein